MGLGTPIKKSGKRSGVVDEVRIVASRSLTLPADKDKFGGNYSAKDAKSNHINRVGSSVSF